MKAPSLINSGTATINMTPMIDVVFLLIIFFLVSSHLAKQENSVSLDLPLADANVADETTGSVVVVNILPDGSWQLGAADVSEPQLAAGLTERSVNSPDGLRLKIRTDKTVPYARIEPVLRAAAQAGIGDVVFSVYDKPLVN
ncbi:MAG: biopolymer transporter ExbD [Aureliella sp.]